MTRSKIIILTLLIVQFKYSFSQSIGGATSGSTAFCTSQNAGFISLSGYTGNVLFWESSINSGVTWNNIGNPTSAQSYYNLNQTTHYRAIVKNGNFPNDTSTSAIITILASAIGGTITGDGAFCVNSGTGTLSLNGKIGHVELWEISTNNGVSWAPIQNTLSVQGYSNITQNTGYRAIVSNIAGCPFDTSTIANIKIDQNTITGSLFGRDSVCFATKNDTVILSGYNGNILDWQKSIGNTNVWQSITNINDTLIIPVIQESINYRSIIKNGSCPTLTTTPFKISVFAINPAFAGEDQTITQYQKVTLNGSGNGVPYWIQNNTIIYSDAFSPSIFPEVSTTYTLMLIDAHSCVTYDEVSINVVIPIPNAITPNNDGVNDNFVIDKIEEYPNNSIKIFNKWGNMVYSASPYQNNFNGVLSNGKDLPDEIYYYILDLGNGETPSKNYILIKR